MTIVSMTKRPLSERSKKTREKCDKGHAYQHVCEEDACAELLNGAQ